MYFRSAGTVIASSVDIGKRFGGQQALAHANKRIFYYLGLQPAAADLALQRCHLAFVRVGAAPERSIDSASERSYRWSLLRHRGYSATADDFAIRPFLSTPRQEAESGARASATARRPMKSRSPRMSTVQANPDSMGVTDSSMSCPYKFIPASSRSVSRAPSPHAATPAPSKSRHRATASCAGQHHLESVLAGIAGARHEHVAAGSGLERSQRFSERAGIRPHLPESTARLRPLNGNHREVASWAQADFRCELDVLSCDPGQILVRSACIDYEPEPRRPQVVGDQIVQYATIGGQHAGIECLSRLLQLAPRR